MNKIISVISDLAFWFVFAIACCLAFAIVAAISGRVDIIPLWLYPFAAFGLVWSLAAGTIPPILLGAERIYKWLSNLLSE